MQNKSINTILKEVSMFSSLKEDELRALEKISHIYEYKEGATLFLEGEVSDSLMLLIDGVVSIFKHDSKGNEIVIGYFNRYALLAEAATLRHTPLPSSATFQSDGAIIKIDIVEFEKLFITHPNISYEIIQSLLKKVDLLQQNIHFNIASNSTEKILHFYRENPTLSLDLKQYEIASILGMVPETFSRNIKKLVKEGKLDKVSTGYKITEKE
ncbi:MAG TPA: Crp/Fnr family transcriptional regulator [Epsilonproteobacteria bacterium]|nr:Crp/Fnr family transcriptional regulator [Campylobacterota bacterium]